MVGNYECRPVECSYESLCKIAWFYVEKKRMFDIDKIQALHPARINTFVAFYFWLKMTKKSTLLVFQRLMMFVLSKSFNFCANVNFTV